MDKEVESKLNAILSAIQGLDARITKIEGGNHEAEKPDRKTKKKKSISEFLIANPPPDSIRRTLAVGYFLEHDAGMSSFTREDLLKGYSDAKEPDPSNINVNINHCIKDGHMMEAREKKDKHTAYVTTRSGEQFVESSYKKPNTKGK